MPLTSGEGATAAAAMLATQADPDARVGRQRGIEDHSVGRKQIDPFRPDPSDSASTLLKIVVAKVYRFM